MASKKLPTRQNQKALYTRQTEQRIALLKEKGLTEKDIAKDSKVKQLKAKLKQLDSAMARISFLDEQKKQLQERKERRKAEAEAAKAAPAAAEKKAKKKSEGKKEAAPDKKKAAAAKPAAKKKTKEKS
jgi:hypothetical protein